jgi:hypothetical protein
MMYSFLRRCPLLPLKIKAQRMVRVSKGVSHQIFKNKKSYYSKVTEILLTEETSNIPFWSNWSGSYLMEELIIFLLFPDNVDDLLSKNISIRTLTKLCDILLHRLIIPIIIHQVIDVLHFFWKQNSSI